MYVLQEDVDIGVIEKFLGYSTMPSEEELLVSFTQLLMINNTLYGYKLFQHF